MIEVNFSDWTLTKLDKTFGLKQIWECHLLDKWEKLSQEFEVSDSEKEFISMIQQFLIKGGKAWNEAELENKFISPLLLLSKIDDGDIGYFLERKLKAVVGEYELSGKVDGMIATGFREPDIPFFCMQEFKKSIENPGRPDAQALAAMMVAKEINENKKPIYGMYVVGLTWTFMILEGNEYCISKDYNADDEEVFTIFKMLKALKKIIKTELIQK